MNLLHSCGLVLAFVQAVNASFQPHNKVQRQFAEKYFPIHLWSNYGKSELLRFYNWLKSAQQQRDALIRLSKAPRLQSVLGTFFSNAKGQHKYWNKPWRKFASVLETDLNWKSGFKDRRKAMVYAKMVQSLTFTGIITLFDSVKRCDRKRFYIDQSWDEIVTLLYNHLYETDSKLAQVLLINALNIENPLRPCLRKLSFGSSTLNSHMKILEEMRDKLLSFRHLYNYPEANLLMPFSLQQIKELLIVFTSSVVVGFFRHLTAIIGHTELLAIIKNFPTFRLVDLFSQQLISLANQFEVTDSLVFAVLDQLHANTIKPVAFMNVLPNCEFIRQRSNLINLINLILQRMEKPAFDFVVAICLKKGVYCNPFTIDSSSLKKLRKSIKQVAIPTDTIKEIRNIKFKNLLQSQPLLAAVAITKRSDDALIFAPAIPIGNALVKLLEVYLSQQHLIHASWHQVVRTQMSNPCTFINNLVERKGYKVKDISRIPPLTMDDESSWNLLFELEN